jgi:hypothetical protein
MSIRLARAAALLAAGIVPLAAFGQQQLPPVAPLVSPDGNPKDGPPSAAAPRMPPVSQPSATTQFNPGIPSYLSARPMSSGPQFPPPLFPFWGAVPLIQSPVAGYLSGVAEVTTAQGQFLNQVQQARLLQAQADSARLDLRRRAIEQQRYLRSLAPTPEEIRQNNILDRINRSRNDPPRTQIWSGRALNDLVVAIQRSQRGGLTGPAVPLDPTMLHHINFTTGTTPGGTSRLRDLGRLQWPIALTDNAFDSDRSQIEKMAPLAAEQGASGPIEATVIRELQRAANSMIANLRLKVDDFTPTEYVQAMRYLRELNDAFNVLPHPNASAYIRGKFRATGSTVTELLQNMTNRGLTFAPATTGDEPFYTALHSALVTYDYGLLQLAAR